LEKLEGALITELATESSSILHAQLIALQGESIRLGTSQLEINRGGNDKLSLTAGRLAALDIVQYRGQVYDPS
jgi:hypothetical protein